MKKTIFVLTIVIIVQSVLLICIHRDNNKKERKLVDAAAAHEADRDAIIGRCTSGIMYIGDLYGEALEDNKALKIRIGELEHDTYL